MDFPIQRFEEIIASTVADMRERYKTYAFDRAFERYKSIFIASIRQYRQHRGNDTVLIKDLKSRFLHETALLHVITRLISHNDEKLDSPHFDIWPIFDSDSIFNWYKLSDDLRNPIDKLAADISYIDNIGLILSEASGHLLRKFIKRYIGEFYTPLSIVEHLIDLSGLEADSLLSGNKVVDPACGGGIILTAIADKVVKLAIEQNLHPQRVIDCISKNLFGFDIQPYAINLTKSLLLHSCLPLMSSRGVTPPRFINIRLLDPLASYQEFWNGKDKFNYVIGNPPFFIVKRDSLHFIENYCEILHGHPNLFQLFLWWAVKSTVPGGIISFLLPQSILSGNYFKNLRKEINEKTELISITRMIDRKGIIADADQQLMAFCVKVSANQNEKLDVTVRVTRNGNDISQSNPVSIRKDRIIQSFGDVTIWVVSDNVVDYTIVDRINEKCGLLSNIDMFEFGNGGYVWNQHRELLLQEWDSGCLPLISAASIEPYTVIFPYNGSHPSRDRTFSRLDVHVQKCVHSGQALLVQRTTPRKVGRRLISGLPSSNFHERYEHYFLENHVNYIRCRTVTDEQSLLLGLMGWLNSDLINFIFQLRNGNTQVSAFEMGLLPVNLEIISDISEHVRLVTITPPQTRIILLSDLNDRLYNWLGLGPHHRRRIFSVLNQKER